MSVCVCVGGGGGGGQSNFSDIEDYIIIKNPHNVMTINPYNISFPILSLLSSGIFTRRHVFFSLLTTQHIVLCVL